LRRASLAASAHAARAGSTELSNGLSKRLSNLKMEVAMTTVSVIDRSVQKTHIWINEMAEELETDDEQHAYRVLRAFLHVLRDRLPVNEAAQLAAQMPDMLRGVYYENWVPSRVPADYRGLETFVERLAEEAQLHDADEATSAASAAARVLRRHISGGEIDDVVAALPAPIAALIAT
jgi:uncharacterized protein (DUF2267 family)